MDLSGYKIIRGARILQQIEAEATLEERSSYQELERKTVRAFPHTKKRQHVVHPVRIQRIEFTPYIGTRNLLVRGVARSGTYNNVYYKPMLFFNEVQYGEPDEKLTEPTQPTTPQRPQRPRRTGPEPEQEDRDQEQLQDPEQLDRDFEQGDQEGFDQEQQDILDEIERENEQYRRERMGESVVTEADQTVTFKASDGKDYHIQPIDLSDNIVRVRCDCLDFYFRFAPWDFSNDDLFGPKPKPYVRKTTHYPPVNPTRSPGICKHVMKLVLALRDKNLLKR